MDKEDHLFSAFKYFDRDNSGYVNGCYFCSHNICPFLFVALCSQCDQAMDLFQYSYITTEELEQALEDHNMGDEETIKDIISEVDTDHVSRYCDKMISLKFMPKRKGTFSCLFINLPSKHL